MSTRAGLLDRATATLAEPIEAWRAWTLEGSKDGSRVRMLPIAGDGRPWPPRHPARSSCTRSRTHVPPEPGCSCGLHAVTDPDDLRRARNPAVVGTVALWGRVIEHEHGYRAALAYPQRLRLVCYLCLALWGMSASSACEVVLRHRGGRMVPLCEPHLELSVRYGYRASRAIPAGRVGAALLSAYAVDLLGETRPSVLVGLT